MQAERHCSLCSSRFAKLRRSGAHKGLLTFCSCLNLWTAITSGGVDQFQISDFRPGQNRKSFRMSHLRASGDDLSGTFEPGRVLLYHVFVIRVILGRASRPARLDSSILCCAPVRVQCFSLLPSRSITSRLCRRFLLCPLLASWKRASLPAASIDPLSPFAKRAVQPPLPTLPT